MDADESRPLANGRCKFILQSSQVVKDNQSIIVFTHSHSVVEGTWNPSGDGHFLAFIETFPIEVHSQALYFTVTSQILPFMDSTPVFVIAFSVVTIQVAHHRRFAL